MTEPRTGPCPDCGTELDGGLCSDCGRTFVGESFREAVERAEPGSVLILDETHGRAGIGRTDLAARLAWLFDDTEDDSQ